MSVIHIAKQRKPAMGTRVLLLSCLLISGFASAAVGAAVGDVKTLSLATVVKTAQVNDPWLVENRHSQEAIESMSVYSGTLPDPQVTVGLANLPTDTFDFDQEAMTQLKVGVSQMFPRGDSLAIKRKQLELQGSQFPFQRQDRRARVVVNVSQLWLDAYKAQESIVLIEKDRPLFEQLADVAEASYSAALGRTRQQDIVRAQLEITRLDDRLTVLKQKQNMFVEKLSEWANEYFRDKYLDQSTTDELVPWSSLVLDKELPSITMINKELYLSDKEANPQELYENFSDHPSVTAIEQGIKAKNIGVDLARQKYKPLWGVNAGYGYREDDQSGNGRSDFVSLGFSFDLPMFTANRQDKEVESAVSQAAAIKTKKWSLIRKMIAGFENNRTQLLRLNERQKLYDELLLPQMHEQAEASLTAYTNDDGDFAEVVRARIAELNAHIDSLGIDVERQKTIVKLNYFFMKSVDDITLADRRTGDTK